MAAASAYPVAAMAVALIADGRQPARWRPQDLVPEALVLPAIGERPARVRRRDGRARRAAAARAAPRAPRHRGGRARGRAGLRARRAAAALRPDRARTPAVAADVGDAGRRAGGRPRDPAGRGAPPWGRAAAPGTRSWAPSWRSPAPRCGRDASPGSPGTRRSSATPAQLAVAARLSRAVRAGDMVLAPHGLSATLLMLDGRVTAVAPRLFYTRALPAIARGAARRSACCCGRSRTRGSRRTCARTAVEAALRALGVDVACVREHAPPLASGCPRGAPATRRRCCSCGRAPPPASRGFWCGSVRDGA